MRVLVVEDDLALGAFLKNGIQLEGHQVDWVGDGDAALVNAVAHLPDLIVLDLSLPKRDGMEVLAELRSLHNDASVLVLTGRNELDARVRCLDLGADDCLLKPFNFSELTARCRALMRRREQFADPILRHGDLALNRMERTVMRGMRAIELTAKEFSLLTCLMLHRGECVSRSQLLTEAWQMPAEGSTNIVDVYINYVRRKLSDGDSHGNAQGELIETVRGSGYRLCSLEPKSKPVRSEDGARTAVRLEARSGTYLLRDVPLKWHESYRFSHRRLRQADAVGVDLMHPPEVIPMSIQDALHNKYSLVKGAARRARQLQSGALPLTATKSMKACRVAQDEIRQGHVTFVVTHEPKDVTPLEPEL